MRFSSMVRGDCQVMCFTFYCKGFKAVRMHFVPSITRVLDALFKVDYQHFFILPCYRCEMLNRSTVEGSDLENYSSNIPLHVVKFCLSGLHTTFVSFLQRNWQEMYGGAPCFCK